MGSAGALPSNQMMRAVTPLKRRVNIPAMLSRWLPGIGALLWCGVCGAAVHVTEFPLPETGGDSSPPLNGPPVVMEDMNHRIQLPLLGMDSEEDVFLTVIFRERGADALRLYWFVEGFSSGILLAENLCDGVRGWNQKTIRLPRLPAGREATLEIEARGPERLVERVVIAAARREPVQMAPDADAVAYVSSAGRRFKEEDVSGGPRPALTGPDTWADSVLDAPLQEEHEILELSGGVEFLVPIDEPPDMALLACELLDSDINAPKPVVWVNGSRLGTLGAESPNLRDHGYLLLEGAPPVYAGWRRAGILIPGHLLRDGENSILIHSEREAVFIQETLLQFRFPSMELPMEASLPLPPDELPDNDTVEPQLPEWDESPIEGAATVPIPFRMGLNPSP